jgi:3-deoxy-D-manno-octulosonic-acid transferase
MTFFYQIGILFYGIAVRISALFNSKARLFIKGRKGWKKNLAESININEKYIWLHCASLGEFEQGRPLIEEIKTRFPEYKILLTFYSPSGYEIRKNYNQADIISYMPLDTKKNARDLIKIINPQMVFFVKYEYWFFYLSELKKQQIPIYVISAIIRENQYFFKNNLSSKWYRKMLFMITYFFVQNEHSQELLQSVGISNCTVSGDTRFDRVAAIAASAKKIEAVEKFKSESLLIVAGSTWKPDEELLAAFINQAKNVKLVVAPHETTITNVNKLEQLLKKPAIRFSNIKNTDLGRYEVLIIDSIGLLSSLYQYGDIAYIGGGFGVGIHNILEAATFSLPVIFGPEYKKFKEAVDLVSLGGAFSIHDYSELNSVFTKLLEHDKTRQKSSKICQNYVQKNTGSTFIIIKKVFNNS